MAERLQILVRKLNDCVNEASDNEVSQYLHQMQTTFDKIPDSLFGDTEWKLDTDSSAAKVYSNIINLVQVVEDVIDSYSFLVSEQRCGKIVSSNNELREILAKMRGFLYEEQELLSQILVFFRGTTSYFLDLLKKFSEKVCKDIKELEMDLWRNSEQPASEAKQNSNEILVESDTVRVNRKSAQSRRGQNYMAKQGSTRQEAAKLSRTQKSTSLPSEQDITVKLSDVWENASFHVDHGTPELQRLVGREMELNKLGLFCTNEKSVPLAIAVTGVEGIGKTSIVEAVYKRVKRQFHCYAWVDMFEKTTSDAVRDMLNLFSKKQPLSRPCNTSTMDNGSLRKTLSSFLTEKKFLLVLDDISSEADWTSVKAVLPENNCNGKVVLTSRLLNFTGCKNIKLEPLNAEDSYNMLFKQHHPKSAEKSTAKEISMICEGNPLAITVIRSMLSAEKPMPLEELHRKLSNVRATMKRNKAGSTNKKNREDVNYVFLICYSTLQPMLKSCFLYCALFPPRSKIPCRKLIRLWIAEGFIDEKNNDDMTMEEVGELQLRKLLGRNMFQMAKMGVDGKPKYCRVLRPLQEFAHNKARQDRFCSASEIGTSLRLDRSLRLSLTARGTNSVCSYNNTDIGKTYQTQLRSLLLLKGENLQASQMKCVSLSKFKLLIVLDLEGVPIKILPDSVRNLCLLHYLGLRHTELIELPSSVGRLKRLETLDVRGTFMRDLPKELEHLNKLRHLLLASSFDDNVVSLPIDISSFTDLQTLSGVKLTKTIAEKLMELHQLQKLSVGKVKNNLLDQLAISIKSMESLRSLTIQCDLGERIHARLFKSSSTIRTLRVEGEVLDLFSWIENLKSLTHLDLRGCILKDDPFVALGSMFNLVCLSVQNAYVGESIRFQKDSFPSLKKLSIAHFQALSQWHMDDDTLENLEKLTIGSCPKLTHLPPYLRKLANLRVMQVKKMPEAFVKEARQLGKEIKKLSVVVLGLSEAQIYSTTITIRNKCTNDHKYSSMQVQLGGPKTVHKPSYQVQLQGPKATLQYQGPTPGDPGPSSLAWAQESAHHCVKDPRPALTTRHQENKTMSFASTFIRARDDNSERERGDMAVRVKPLLRKLNECAGEVPEEISEHLLKMEKKFEQALQLLSGDSELIRESNEALDKAISLIVGLVQEVEDIIDSYSYEGQSIFIRKWEVYSKMYQFLHKDQGIRQVGVMFLYLISRPSFPDMLKNFSDQVCSHLEELHLHTQNILENERSDFSSAVCFADELDGREEFDLSHGESEHTNLSEDEIILTFYTEFFYTILTEDS